jgi:hypothetical protein
MAKIPSKVESCIQSNLKPCQMLAALRKLQEGGTKHCSPTTGYGVRDG